ncbi:DUF2637 domain-containing protein [Spirillospora sp. CA-142024]|uniref:DUF2637 domain-containing protein n=1 Tax=Spirillospora sp. CA-142024 TaxID=3240036 RepID=UPI003D91DCDD
MNAPTPNLGLDVADTGHRDESQARKLSPNEFTAVAVVAAMVAILGLLGFVNSFAAVADAARPSFGGFAWTVPLGIDLGIAIFAALDIVLGRLDMRVRWLRLIPWTLTGATVYLNVADETTAFGKVAHAVLPCLWVAAVEIGAHVVRVRAGIEAGTRMDGIRASRWILAPVRTVSLWRRMVLWEIRSYPDALNRERSRLLVRTDLQDTYGAVAWRWKAPRKVRALYRLGELAPAPTAPSLPSADRPALDAGPSAPGEPDPSAPAEKTVRRTGGQTTRGRSAPKSGGRSRTGARTSKRTTKRTVPDVDDLMPLGWRIAADLEARDVPLKRDVLAAEIRKTGQTVSSERVGALLDRLKSEAPTDPTSVNATDTAVSAAAEGSDAR